jgi:acetoin utilization protein AcuB
MANAPQAERPGPSKANLAMRQVMTRTPYTIGSEQSLAKAHAMMREHGLRHLPVLRGGKLVGVLSQRDLYFVESIAGVDDTVDTVADAMTPEVYTVGPEEKVSDVVRTMAVHRYGSAVVVDRAQVVGIFTATDALFLLADRL